MQPAFIIGQVVCLRADPSRQGPIITILPPAGGRPRYRVFHSPQEIREYHEDQLASAEATRIAHDVTDAIGGTPLAPDVFRARLTAARLSHPQMDNLYALRAARIQSIPFQFKPLLRFLRADQPRLLIADEVGVGKTIEAGLILKELETRQHVDNVLVVCPKALVPKWRMEMRRFDEDFRPLTSESLQHCLKETQLDGVWPAAYARAIVHLELLRGEEYLYGTNGRRSRPGLFTLDPPPHFSLVIVDEAHHLRNPGTNSHELARFLCDNSEAVVFLSATPVHIGSRNLFTLLNLLRPDLFPSQAVFQETTEPNPYITQAMRHVRAQAPRDTWLRDAANALQDASNTSWGQQVLQRDPRFIEWYPALQKARDLPDTDRIRCLRDLEEVHTLAHVMNRTRRRDIGRFTIREPHTVSVSFTTEQQNFYDALIDFRREMLLLEHDPGVVRLILDTLERQAASCLPALVPTLDAFLLTGRFSSNDLTDDVEDDSSIVGLPTGVIQRAQELRRLADRLPTEDPKLDRLFEIIRKTITGEGPGKVLTFSFFLHTLAYLEEHLRSAGIRVAVITGRVADEERERLRDRFRLPRENSEALDVLLSSEVGCEGLDYEFCDRLVNYDIPWNPMRIEQRVGRIDRFGQMSEKVLIFNFITPGTVEDRIFFRCFERLGVFRDTVGDHEEILGNVVESLNRIALDPALSPRQAEENACQAADNAIRLIDERQRLEEENGAFLGLDQAFAEDVDTLLTEGRFISPDDLRVMVGRFVEEPGLAGKIIPDERRTGVDRLRLNKDGRAALLEEVRNVERVDRPTVALRRWLEGNDPHLLLTFEQQTALEHRDLPFVTPVHPLARIAIKYWASASEPLVSHLAVCDDTIPAGRYVFLCDLWETLAVKPEIRLVGLAWDLERRRPAPEVSAVLIRLLGRATNPHHSPLLTGDDLTEGAQELTEEFHRLRLIALGDLRQRNAALVARKLASLDTYHRSRHERVQRDVQCATDDRIRRMREAERGRIEDDYQRNRREIEGRREADIISQRVAAGILEVTHAE